jgi:hypothetical protein
VPLVEAPQSSPVDHPHVVVPALMGGTSQLVCHTLLGPEETAAPVLTYWGSAVVFLSAGSLSGRIPGSACWGGVVWCVQGLGGEPVGV